MNRDPKPGYCITNDTDSFSWCRNKWTAGVKKQRAERPEPGFRNKGERFKIRIQELDKDPKHGYKKRDPEPPQRKK